MIGIDFMHHLNKLKDDDYNDYIAIYKKVSISVILHNIGANC